MLEAVNGLSGLDMAEQTTPNIILLDINLPDIDGTEVTARLKQNPDLRHIPVIAVTANAMYGDKERFIDAGCDGYISKPLSKELLLDTIHALLQREPA
jgi:two-component system cell cycle response regulator DivK